MYETQSAGRQGTEILDLLKQAILSLTGSSTEQASLSCTLTGQSRAVHKGSDVEVPPSSQHARLACRLLYRLATYADQRYRATVQQKRTPEFIKQQKVHGQVD
jgi:hypothetical protein